MNTTEHVDDLIHEMKSCDLCAGQLPLGPRPVFQISQSARILIAGQAPGRVVHESGVPFMDASGARLRAWLGLSENQFYDANLVAILPMGFCYPGSKKSGDLPPRPECAEKWRARALAQLQNITLTVLLGKYAIAYHLPNASGSLAEISMNWRDYGGNVFPIPHPSPRNNIWLKRNPWFAADVLPELQARVQQILVETAG